MLGLFKDGRKGAVYFNEVELPWEDPTSSANDDKWVVWFQVALDHLLHVLPRHLALPMVLLGRAGCRSQPGVCSDSVDIQAAPKLVSPHYYRDYYYRDN